MTLIASRLIDFSDIRLSWIISVNSCRISVCTELYPPISVEYPSVQDYIRQIRLRGIISVCTRIYPSIRVEYPSVRDYIRHIRLRGIISVCTRIYPSIRVEYPSVRDYIRQFVSNIRLYRNISVNPYRNYFLLVLIYSSLNIEYNLTSR